MNFRNKSLRVRVLINVFLTSLFMLLLMGMLIFSQITSLTKSVEKKELLEQARKIASYIEYDWLGRFEVDLPRRYQDYYGGGTSSHQFAVMDSNGNILFRSQTFMRDKIKDTLKKSGKHYFNFEAEDGKYFAGLKYDYLFEDTIYPVYVIEYEEEFSEFISALEENFLHKVLMLGVPLLLFQAFIIFMIFKDTLKPILRASKEARNINYDNLSFRLNEDNVHTEILPLIKSVNNSLARLEKKAETQKFFIANAAHELRTPISILKARIASLKDEKEVFLLNEDLRNINRLISQMLDISRLDISGNVPMTDINLNEIARKACEDMGPLFIAQGKEISLDEIEPDQIINGNEDTIFRSLLNLLENALKHTPEKTPVEMIIEENKIIVRDYGTPIPEENKIKIFERFEKLPENTSTKGSGLGLSIVKKTAELHNGAISIVSRADGNDFVLEF